MSTTSTTTTGVDYASYAQPRKRHAVGTSSVSTDLDAKVVIMGSAGVGKTSLVQRYTTNTFNSTKIAATAGAGFSVKKTQVNGTTVRLQLWDTAGQERFRSLAPMYYRGSHAAILVYDITNPQSFDDVQEWLRELKKNVPHDSENDMIIYVVGTKADLALRHRKITIDQARSLLTTWFPPPKPPTPPPPPTPSSALIPYYAPSYPFNGQSVYSSSALSSISTSVSTHLPSLPSFNLNLNQMRPRFSSLTSNVGRPLKPPVIERPGESPTGTDSTGGNGTTTTATTGSSSSFMPAPIPTNSRLGLPRSATSNVVPTMSNLGLNVNMSGSTYSSFSAMESPGGLVEFPSLGAPSLVRRNTAAGTSTQAFPQSAVMRTSRSAGGRQPRTRIQSDDEDRGRDRRPSAYRRLNEVESFRPRAGDSTSSGEDREHRPRFYSNAGRVREQERLRREEGEQDEQNDDVEVVGDQTWGFSKELQICEVSAKDGRGVGDLFSSILQAILKRREVIEREKRLRERDSVMLNVPTTVPSWGALAEEDDQDGENPAANPSSSWSCCRI